MHANHFGGMDVRFWCGVGWAKNGPHWIILTLDFRALKFDNFNPSLKWVFSDCHTLSKKREIQWWINSHLLLRKGQSANLHTRIFPLFFFILFIGCVLGFFFFGQRVVGMGLGQPYVV